MTVNDESKKKERIERLKEEKCSYSIISFEIKSYMIHQYELKGNELLIYAYIYSFKNHKCDLSIIDIAKFLTISVQTVASSLKVLMLKKLIKKNVFRKSNFRFIEYTALDKEVCL